MDARKTLAITSFILLVKWYATLAIQGGKRFAGGSRPPEDAQLGLNKSIGKGREQVFVSGTSSLLSSSSTASDASSAKAAARDKKLIEGDIRWQRIVQNDVENIPMALIMGLVCVTVDANATVTSTALIVFTLSRVLHTYYYANAVQPGRAIAWFGGILASLTMAGNAAVSVFAK